MKSLYYNHYYNLFKNGNDLESLGELIRLSEYCPEFNFEKFRIGIFTVKNIEKYGYNFLMQNIELLTSEILEIKDQQKLDLIIEYDRLARLKPILINQLSVEELKKLIEFMNDYDYCDVLAFISGDDNGLKIIRDLMKKEDIYKRLSFMVTSFEFIANYYIVSSIVEIIYDSDFDHFMKIIDNNYLNNRFEITDFIRRYCMTKKHLPVSKELTEKFNSYFFSHQININNTSELVDYYEMRYKEVEKYITNNDLNSSKEFVCLNYFNNSYENVKPVLENILKIKERGIYLPYFRTSKLLSISTKEELIEFVKEIKDRSNIFDFLVKNSKQICINDLVKTIDSKLVKDDSKIKLLDGEDFLFLLHKVKGYGNIDYASRLREDPSLWDKKYDPNSYVSTTLVWEDYFSLVEGSGYILGFYPSLEDIVAMGPKDIYVSSKQIRHNLNNSKAQFLLTDELKDKTLSVCNEIALIRYREKKSIKPDFVFVFDEITAKDQEVADYFSIPIYILKTEVYAQKMKEKLMSYLEQGNLDLYANRLLKMFLSFSQNHLMISKYFSLEQIEKEIASIIEKYGVESTEGVIDAYNRIIIMRNYYEENHLEISVPKILKKVFKSIDKNKS